MKVAKCIASGLVGGEALSVDASLIKADVRPSSSAVVRLGPRAGTAFVM
jgi:hypothetical protein